MTLSHSYLRALIANLIVLAALVAWVFHVESSFQSKSHAGTIIVLEAGGVVGLIATLLIGTLSHRSTKPWPWFVISIWSVIFWIVVLLIVLRLSPNAGDLVVVKPPNTALEPTPTAP
jgi:hypothetical protein